MLTSQEQASLKTGKFIWRVAYSRHNPHKHPVEVKLQILEVQRDHYSAAACLRTSGHDLHSPYYYSNDEGLFISKKEATKRCLDITKLQLAQLADNIDKDRAALNEKKKLVNQLQRKIKA